MLIPDCSTARRFSPYRFISLVKLLLLMASSLSNVWFTPRLLGQTIGGPAEESVASGSQSEAIGTRDHAANLAALLPVVLPWSDGRVMVVKSPAEADALLGLTKRPHRIVKAVAITWVIDYRDVAAHGGRGFDSKTEGPARRKALEEMFAEIATVLGGNGARTVSVRVEESDEVPGAALASAGSPAVPGSNGFVKTHLQRVLQDGVDPMPGYAEVVVRFNFHQSKVWHTGSGAPPALAFDLRSVALHELTHALGFASFLDAQGRSRITQSNPGVFSVFDSFITRQNGSRLVAAGGRSSATASDLTGETGSLSFSGPQTIAAAGAAPSLFTPAPYQEGSSISHWATRLAQPVMAPALSPGVRRRNFTEYEAAALRDLGYVTAAVPRQPFNFAPPTQFPTFSHATAMAVQHLDDSPGPDLVVLERNDSDSLVEIYSGMDPQAFRVLRIPRSDFVRMSAATPGPQSAPGLVLGSLSQGTLLALGGLKLPPTPRPLTLSDFAHVHQVTAWADDLGASAVDDAAVPSGDLNGDGAIDFVGYVRALGSVGYVNDGTGYFDRVFAPREVMKIGTKGSVTRDVSVFTGGLPPGAVGLEIPCGISPEIVVEVLDPPGSNEGRLLDSGPTTYLKCVSRISGVGFGVVVDRLGREDVVALSFQPPAPQPFQVVRRWHLDAAVWQVLTLREPPTRALFVTSAHTLELVDRDSSAIKRLAGGTAGYRDGPLDQAQFNRPTALCEGDGVIYVVDAGNSLIRKVDLRAGVVSRLAGRPGVVSMVDGPDGTGTLAFRSGAVGATNCALIGDSLYVMNAAAPSGPFALRKVNVNTRAITTVPASLLGSYTWPAHLRTHGNRLYFVDGPTTEASLRRVDLFPKSPDWNSSSGVLRIADVDNDGRGEVLNLMTAVGAVAISRFEPDGTFSQTSSVGVKPYAISIECQDVNADGNRDLVVLRTAAVDVYLGDGSGAFVPDPIRSLSLSSGSNVWGTVQNLNQDAQLDVAMLDAAGVLRVFLGDAQGRWGWGPGNDGEQIWAGLDLGAQPRWFSLSDIDQDGWADVQVLTAASQFVMVCFGQP